MLRKIINILNDIIEIDEIEKINKSTRLLEDLKMDELDVPTLILELEEYFKINISIEEVIDIKTIGDVVTIVENHIKSRKCID